MEGWGEKIGKVTLWRSFPPASAGDTGREVAVGTSGEVQGPPTPPWLIHGVRHLLQSPWRYHKSLPDAVHASRSGFSISKTFFLLRGDKRGRLLVPNATRLPAAPASSPVKHLPALSHPGGSSRHRQLLDASHTDLSPRPKNTGGTSGSGSRRSSPGRLE